MPAADAATDEVTKHLLGRLVVGDHAVAKRPRRPDVRGCTPDHPACVLADRPHLARQLVDCDDRRLEDDDTVATAKNDGVRRAEVDRKGTPSTR